MRRPNTTTTGHAFGSDWIQAVWQKGQAVAGYDALLYRKDACGAWMSRNEYGQTTTWGWEIDHIRPVALGGADFYDNLQPLQWQNNRHKSDNFPNWGCAVAA
jgi:5-methylcytosine-specific restriction endonuclease McrA